MVENDLRKIVKHWIKNILFRKELILLILITALAAFLRLYRLEDLMTYLGDEGRDMMIVADIVDGKNLPFIGPPTSIGELYLGPIYYYFITPFAWIFGMSPVGPAIFVVLLGILSIPLIYLVGKKFFNQRVGLIAALIYAISPIVVEFSRSSWNPNPMPFFTLLLFYCLYQCHQHKQVKYLYFSIVIFAIMLQLHYIVILTSPFILFVIYKMRKVVANKKSIFLCLLIFLLFMSPLFLFDLKHNFVNSKGLLTIFQYRSKEGFNIADVLSRSRDRLRQLFSLVAGFEEREWRTNIMVIVSLMFGIYDWWRNRNFPRLIIYGWLAWGLLVIGLYRRNFYPHYLGFLFPLPAIIWAKMVDYFWHPKAVGKILYIIATLLLCQNMVNKTWTMLSRPSVLNIKVVKQIVDLIKNESNSQQFNFALLANDNYDDSYRYFFRLLKLPAIYQTEVAKQLFVVCEDEDICHPQGNPKWEIALFDAAYNGNISLSGQWTPNPLVKVFKFVPTIDQE